MYDLGYQHGRDGEPYDPEHEGDREYVAGHSVGDADRREALDPEFVRNPPGGLRPLPILSDVGQAAQDFVDGYRRGEAGDEFQIALLESAAYRAGFRDGERMLGVYS